MNTSSKRDRNIAQEIAADQLACFFGALLTSLLGEAQAADDQRLILAS